MSPIEIIVPIVTLLIVGGAIAYIIRAKKSGKRCIGCPAAGTCGKGRCSGACHGCSGCSSAESEKNANSEANKRREYACYP